jgi:hypothetical protein
MRILACLLVMTATAAAEEPSQASPEEPFAPSISVGLTGSIAVERNVATLMNVQLGFPMRAGYWIDASIGLGGAGLIDPAGSGQGESSAYEARVGLARLSCGASTCGGLVGSLGFHHQRIEFEDELVEPPMWTEMRDLGFAELRAVGRLRIASGRVGIEAALGARFHAAINAEHAKGGVNAGLLASLGLHVTI